MKYYIVHPEDSIEPILYGPWIDEKDRDSEAKGLHKTLDDRDRDDPVFWLNVDENGEPTTGSYSGGFFDGI